MDKRKIRYHWPNLGVRLPGFSEAVDPDTGLPAPDVPTVEAFIPVAGADGLVVEDGIIVDFKFDDMKQRLVDITVKQMLTGP